MIIRMTTTSRPQQTLDHRLRDLVQRTGDLTIATDLGVPRSAAHGWLGAAPTSTCFCLDEIMCFLSTEGEKIGLAKRWKEDARVPWPDAEATKNSLGVTIRSDSFTNRRP